MGYKRKRTLYKLTFENPDFDGLEVTVKSVSIGQLASMLELIEVFEDREAEDFKAEDLAKVEQVLRLFAGMLHSWNLEEDDGTPVPATYEGLAGQDFDFVLPVMEKAIAAISQAPPPLPGGSPSGGNSEAVPPALASQSRSLPSSSLPS